MIDSIGMALDLPVQYDFVPMPEHLQDRYQYFTQANISKLRSAGYIASFHSVENGVADYVLNYLDASDRYR